MNRRIILYYTGLILLIEAGFLILPMIVGWIYGERQWIWFAVTILLNAVLGAALRFLTHPDTHSLYAREGFVTVALCWIAMSLTGALPFFLSGEIPNYLDAVFETVSGFTTTGASILTDIEAMSHCMLFWRSFTHWLGGMGILVFMLAIMPQSGGQSINLLRAESPGPTVTKMVPKMRDSALILYAIYGALTLIETVLLVLGGMPLFDSLCHAFGTAGTGGLSVKSASIGAYDSYYLQGVIAVFMMLFGVNFTIYYLLLKHKWREALRSTELRVYLGIIAFAVITITINLTPTLSELYYTVHNVFFTVSSIMTTTGYCTVNFDAWPLYSRVLLVLLMCIGACAGSTGGGIKVSRVVISCKIAASDVRRMLHPRSVKVVTLDGRRVDDDSIHGIHAYLLLYIAITGLSVLLVALDNLDFTTSFTAVIATLNNIGPGLNLVGPEGNYTCFSALSKVVLCLDMLFGRLEIFPMLYLLMPGSWRTAWRPLKD